MEVVRTYKYVGLHLDNKLDWSENTDALYRKGWSQLYFLSWLEQTPPDVLAVCHGRCPLPCCGLLGRQHEEEGRWATGQAGDVCPVQWSVI